MQPLSRLGDKLRVSDDGHALAERQGVLSVGAVEPGMDLEELSKALDLAGEQTDIGDAEQWAVGLHDGRECDAVEGAGAGAGEEFARDRGRFAGGEGWGFAELGIEAVEVPRTELSRQAE